MAEMAGMRLRERWSGWHREPFTSDSTKHVSVWEKPASVDLGQPGPSSPSESFCQPRCLRSQPTDARWYDATSS